MIEGVTLLLLCSLLMPPVRAASTAGAPWAWGINSLGEAGNGLVTNTTTPAAVNGLNGASAIAGGGLHSLAVATDGTVMAWGYNYSGQLGTTLSVNCGAGSPCSPTATEVVSLTSIVRVAAGGDHSMALRADGTVWTWGDNSGGELGDGVINMGANPIPVRARGLWAPGAYVVAIAAGHQHDLALRSDGTVWAWGSDSAGQLGTTAAFTCSGGDNGPYPCSPWPLRVSGLVNVVGIAAGGDHSLALKSDGTVWAWGDNSTGELGNGTADYAPHPTPVQVSSAGGPGTIRVVALAAGGRHNMVLRSNGTVRAWGDNSVGQLGVGIASTNACQCIPIPIQTVAISGVVRISAGFLHSVAETYTGAAWAWGDDTDGQLGSGSFANCDPQMAYTPCSPVPVRVGGLPAASTIASGEYHNLALIPSS